MWVLPCLVPVMVWSDAVCPGLSPWISVLMLAPPGKVISKPEGARIYVEGVDTQRGGGAAFTWRGTGLLVFFVSEWEIAAIDPDGAWAVVSFSKLLAIL